MATINAARMLKWDRVIGSIEPGKRADLAVIDGQSGDAYDRLIQSRETTVSLVVINGIPRYGASGLMAKFGGAVETLRVGDSERALNFEQATADPVVGALSLSAAVDRLSDGLRRLPDIATERVDEPGARAASPADAGAERWFLDLDQAPADGSLVRLKPPLGLGESIADVTARQGSDDRPLIPLRLDPLTVVDDGHFATLVRNQPNLPDRIKQDLPRFYGK